MNSLVHTKTEEVLVKDLDIRTTFWGRFWGLLGHRDLKKGSAMLLIKTRRVHTYGMFFPLDLYFFSEAMHLIDARYRVMPGMVPESPKGTLHVLEIKHLPDTEPLKLNIGEQVSILWKLMS